MSTAPDRRLNLFQHIRPLKPTYNVTPETRRRTILRALSELERWFEAYAALRPELEPVFDGARKAYDRVMEYDT